MKVFKNILLYIVCSIIGILVVAGISTVLLIFSPLIGIALAVDSLNEPEDPYKNYIDVILDIDEDSLIDENKLS